MILEHNRSGQVDQHLIADEAARPDPQRLKPAPIDIDQGEAVDHAVTSDPRPAQPEQQRAERRKTCEAEDDEQDRDPHETDGPGEPDLLEGLHEWCLRSSAATCRKRHSLAA